MDEVTLLPQIKSKSRKKDVHAVPFPAQVEKILLELFNGDGTAGAGVNAGTAAHAGIFNDHSLVAFELDSFGGAGVETGTATGAGIFVNFSSHFLFLLVDLSRDNYNITPTGIFFKSISVKSCI